MRILAIHPGHRYSTGDVYDGMCAGLEANGIEVVTHDLNRTMTTMDTYARAVAGATTPEEGQGLYRLGNWLASGDVLHLAIDAEVDAVIVVTGLLFPYERIRPLRKLGIPVACYGTEAPYFQAEEERLAAHYSHWFTNERRSVARFSQITRCTHLPHAWNPRKHLPGAVDPAKVCDVAFVGGGFPERKRLLDGVAWGGIHLERRGTLWQGEDDLQAGAIPNAETLEWHRSARIALNIHRRMTRLERRGDEVAPGSAESLGPRAYEIPACGGFMLCDDERAELFDVYGDAAATYRAWDSASLEREIRYWLARPDRREETARMQHAAAQAHSWTIRARQMVSDLFA